MIKGLGAAFLIGAGSLILATLGVAFILPWLIARRWRRRTHAVSV